MSKLIMHVALVSQVDQSILPSSELASVTAAISKQVARDFDPIWGVVATVDAFPSLRDVPPGYWPVTVSDDIGDSTAAGYHTDRNGNPFALVQFGPSWSLTASHEVLEMLADPFGNRVIGSCSPVEGDNSRVEILVEVCDPSEDSQFSYTINGVTVSDFYTPHYFDPVPTTGALYSFTNALTKPRQVLKGGYLSFHDLNTDHWKQISFLSGTKPEVVDLGILSAQGGVSIRSQVDRLVKQRRLSKALPRTGKAVSRSRTLMQAASISSHTKADMWQEQIRALCGKKP